MAVLGIFVYVGTLFAAPILFSVWFKDYVLWFNKPYITLCANAYARMVWIRHFSNACIRLTMCVVTRVVVLRAIQVTEH